MPGGKVQPKGRKPPTLPSPTTIKKLPRESLLLHLNNHHLSTKGSKPILAARLFKFATNRKGQRSHKTSTRKHATPGSVREDDNGEPAGSSAKSPEPRQSSPEASQSHSDSQSEESSEDPDLTTQHSTRKRKASHHSQPEHHHHHKRQKRDLSADHRRRHHSWSTSSSSSTSSSEESTSSSSSSTTVSSDDSSRERSRSSRRRRKRHHRHHRRSTRHRHDLWYDPSLQSSVACAPPLPRHIHHRIRRGKYVSFNKLLLPKGTIPISHVTQETRKGKHKQSRDVEDLATWLEAWNRYLCVRVASSPATALELVKYQTLMVMFFTHHQAEQCIHYDDLFRRAAAQDPTLRWDAIKEDIYVWAFIKHNQKPAHTFRDKPPITSRLGPPITTAPKQPSDRITQPTDRATHTTAGKEICKRFNSAKCTSGDDCIFTHVCWHQHCQGPHPGKGCTKKS